MLAVALDQWVKWLCTEHLTESEPVRVLGGLVYLSLLRNGGAAFTMGAAHTWVFSAITLVVIGWIAWTTRRLRSVPWAVSLGLVRPATRRQSGRAKEVGTSSRCGRGWPRPRVAMTRLTTIR